MRSNSLRFAAAALTAAGALWAGGRAAADGGLTTLPSGGNQRSTVEQGIGLVKVSIEYSSPHVHSPAGEDRRGKIWGALVPYGMQNMGLAACGEQCPWRGGANENTVFSTDHDVKVQGQPLPAGTYGLHFIPGKDEWTVIFSKNHTSWGSFSYDAKEDALRVTAKPAKGDYHEDLTYWFRDRKMDGAVAVLSWEELELPFAISVDNPYELYVDQMRRELRSTQGFSWEGWTEAAKFCLDQKVDLDQGLKWAEIGAHPPFGQVNFTSLSVLADLQDAKGLGAEAKKNRAAAVHYPGADPIQVHLYGRQLLAAGRNQEAMEVFEANAKMHPNVWPVHVGLARGYAALGRRKEALAEAKLALPQAPDDPNRQGISALIKQLEAGKD
jgi:hypothetical protein